MANRYFVSGTSWSSASGWSDTSGGTGGIGIPTIDDDVFFDELSPTTCYVSQQQFCRNLTMTGFTGTLYIKCAARGLQVLGNFVAEGTALNPITIAAYSAGYYTKAWFDVYGSVSNVTYVNASNLSSQEGYRIYSSNGVLTNSPFWRTTTPSETPISIYDADDLQAIADNLDADYILENDINLDGYSFQTIKVVGTGQRGWSEMTDAFTGTLDGNGKKILNLSQTATLATDYVQGLFGMIGVGATVKDLTIENISFSMEGLAWSTSAGALAFYCFSANISNVNVSNITFDGGVEGAGLLYYVSNYFSTVPLTISGCSVDGIYFLGNEGYGGGLIDTLEYYFGDVTIENCNTKNMSSESQDVSSGFILNLYGGDNDGPTLPSDLAPDGMLIKNCYSENLTRISSGFMAYGYGYESTPLLIQDCYVKNMSFIEDEFGLFSDDNISGFITDTDYEVEISRCYVDGLEIDLTTDGTIGVIGGFIGSEYGGSTSPFLIDDCYVINSTISISSIDTDPDGVGGFIGYAGGDVEITGCSSSVDISCADMGVIGGFIGYSDGGASYPVKIMRCYSVGDISLIKNGTRSSGAYSVGGFIGWVDDYTEISDCYSRASIDASSYQTGDFINIGGFIGDMYRSSATNCYSSGDVAGPDYIGGFVGYIYAGSLGDSTLKNCFSAGSITAESNFGGFIGGIEMDNYIINCSWYSGSSTNSIGDFEGSGPVPLLATGGYGTDEPDNTKLYSKTHQVYNQSDPSKWDFYE